MCQFPSTGILHFYEEEVLEAGKVWRCQFPSTGILHFYGIAIFVIILKKEMCQFPSTGILHFYGTITGIFRSSSIVSIPFYGYPAFLPGGNFKKKPMWCVNSLLRVSCISTRPIYPKDFLCTLCQFPSTGILHFYVAAGLVLGVSAYCVNSLLRVSCISTEEDFVNAENQKKVSIPFYGYPAFLQD